MQCRAAWHAICSQLRGRELFNRLPYQRNLLLSTAGVTNQTAHVVAQRIVFLRDAVNAELRHLQFNWSLTQYCSVR